MKQKLLALVLAFTLIGVPATMASSCATFKTNPSQTEVEQTRALAAKVVVSTKHVTLALRAVQDLEITLHTAGTINDTDHRRIQSAFLMVFKALDAALVRIGEATTVPNLRTTLELVSRDLATLSQSLAVSHPQAAKTLQTAAVAVTIALDVVFALLGGA